MAVVYSYIRFSSKPQEKGDSVRRQKALGDGWMNRHPEHTLDTTLKLSDLGISAFKGANLDKDKGDLGRFIHLAKQGRIPKGSILMLENLDRFSRQKTRKAYRVFCELVEAGVKVLTLDPEQMIDEENIDNMEVVLPVIIKMQLSYEESRKKSERSMQAWEGKRSKIGERKLTARGPQWLRLTKDGKSFEVIPDRVEIVRKIFSWANSGSGALGIVRRLNRDGVPCFNRAVRGNRAKWQDGYVRKILRNRAVLGEFQPRRGCDGKWVAAGDPIPGYFPAIIDEQEFYSVQRAQEARRGKGGRHGKRASNLFTGLLKDARDGSSMVIVDKGNGPSLVSSAAKTGVPGAAYISFSCEAFERAILLWGYDLNLGEILPRRASNLEAEIQKAQGRLADLEHRVGTLKEKMRTAEKFETLVDLLMDLERDRTAAHAKVERLKREAATREEEALHQTKELIAKLRAASEAETYDLRIALRGSLRRLIRDIVVLVIQINRDRVALADIELLNGKRRRVTIMPGKRVNLPDGLDGLDLRKWANWPAEFQQSQFRILPDEARQMMELEDAGYRRNEIAKQLGTTKANVSRELCSQGRRKQNRKPADSDRLMTFHPQGRGWAKTHRSNRYFVGLGTLKRLYPRLVKEKSEEGSWRAANRWWKTQMAGLKRDPPAGSKGSGRHGRRS
jgi:DNA invertase Pin-like site-specific DNA recombinase